MRGLGHKLRADSPPANSFIKLPTQQVFPAAIGGSIVASSSAEWRHFSGRMRRLAPRKFALKFRFCKVASP